MEFACIASVEFSLHSIVKCLISPPSKEEMNEIDKKNTILKDIPTKIKVYPIMSNG
ncbi:MAG: hypothetical protein ACI84C_002541 [Flavobacteriales bacterium]|jgi:hypothetical protein